MSATVINLAIEQGVSFSQIISVGSIDLTDYTLSSQIKASANPTLPSLANPTITPIDPVVPGDPIISFTLSLTPAQTLALPVYGKNYSTPTVFTYDVIGTKIDGTVTRFVNGSVSISPAVTR